MFQSCMTDTEYTTITSSYIGEQRLNNNEPNFMRIFDNHILPYIIFGLHGFNRIASITEITYNRIYNTIANTDIVKCISSCMQPCLCDNNGNADDIKAYILHKESPTTESLMPSTYKMIKIDNFSIIQWDHFQRIHQSSIGSYLNKKLFPYVIKYYETPTKIPPRPEQTHNIITMELMMVITKNNHNYYRIFNESKKDNFFIKDGITKILKPRFLSLEYFHKDMKERITIELEPEDYLEGNEVLSSSFIYRLLSKQSKPFVFGDDYQIQYIDWHVNIGTIQSNQYVVITKEGFDVVGLALSRSVPFYSIDDV